MTPWVNARGRIQLNAQLTGSITTTRIVINMRTRAKHASTPPSDKWEIVAVHPIEDRAVNLKDLARGYMRMHAALFGYKYEGSFAGFADGAEVEHG